MTIPPAVFQELSHYSPGQPGSIRFSEEPWTQVHPIRSEQNVSFLLPTLDRGETEVIALAQELQPQLVLIDELTGRNVARALGLNISGSVGALIQAKERGYIPKVYPLLKQMREAGIYLEEGLG